MIHSSPTYINNFIIKWKPLFFYQFFTMIYSSTTCINDFIVKSKTFTSILCLYNDTQLSCVNNNIVKCKTFFYLPSFNIISNLLPIVNKRWSDIMSVTIFKPLTSRDFAGKHPLKKSRPFCKASEFWSAAFVFGDKDSLSKSMETTFAGDGVFGSTLILL